MNRNRPRNGVLPTPPDWKPDELSERLNRFALDFGTEFRMQTRAGFQIDRNAQFRHQQIVYPSHVNQGEFAVWIDLDEDVDITVWASLSPCRRAEEIRGRHPRARNAVSRRPISARAWSRFMSRGYTEFAAI